MAERERVSRVQKKDILLLANQLNNGKISGGSHPLAMMQRAKLVPQSLTPADIVQLQKTMGNQAVCQLMAEAGLTHEDSGLLQEMDAMSSSLSLQRVELPEEEEEPLQMKRENNTGLPDALKSGVENLSGIDMSDVRVHYSSDKPAQIGALAYTQGTEIHVAPGQEKHLPHETWHVVQQAQGKVQPTMQMQGLDVNDDVGLEKEADEMGRASETFKPSFENETQNLNAANKELITDPYVRTIQKNDDKTIQMVVNSAIAGKAALTQVNFTHLLTLAALRNYIWNTEPIISTANNIFELRWDDAIVFADGVNGTLYIHMHEGELNYKELYGGGAWIGGGAPGHDVNIDNNNRIKQTCVAWIQASDYAEGFYI